MLATLDIRRAGPGDAAKLAALARSSFIAVFDNDDEIENARYYAERTFSDAQIRAELADASSTFIWAQQTGIPAGYAKLRRGTVLGCVTRPRPVQLERMYVDTDKIGAGVGKKLLHTAIKIAQSEGYQTLWLGVWEDNSRAVEFYQRQGFDIVGENDFMLGHLRQTDLIMALNLRP